ncbi:MAG: UbiA family prenyltransferase [Pirellulaceae bacterium]
MTKSNPTASSPGKLLAYLQLFRAPNIFTAVADVAMGFLFVQQALLPPLSFLLLASASVLLYMAGMVLNDVYDFDVDLRERPERPLPSGRIPVTRAKWLGYELLVVGIALGWLGGYAVSAGTAGWRSGVVTCLLAVCIWLYDAVLKQTLAGPWLMGCCRFLNVLLGMSIAQADQTTVMTLFFAREPLMVAGGIGIYVAGITWYARHEAAVIRREGLVFGTVVMMVGIGLLAFFPRLAGTRENYFIEPTFVWPMAVFLISVSILRRCLLGAMDPHPLRVQSAVRQCLLSIIILDASVCLLTCPWYWAVGVLLLLPPTLILGKWVYST